MTFPHAKQSPILLTACGGDLNKCNQLVEHIKKQQDVVDSLYTNKDNSNKVTSIINTQRDNCFTKAPTKHARANSKAYDNNSNNHNNSYNSNNNAKGKGKGKAPDGKGKSTGKGKPQKLTGNHFVVARSLDADMLTFEGDDGEPAHRIVDGELLGREAGYDMCTQEYGMQTFTGAYKESPLDGVNCSVIFAVDVETSLQQDWSMGYTLRYSPTGADIAMQATPTARPVVTACTICHVSGPPLHFPQHQIAKFEAPEILNCEMNFAIYKTHVKRSSGTCAQKAHKRPPTQRLTSPVSSAKNCTPQGTNQPCKTTKQENPQQTVQTS